MDDSALSVFTDRVPLLCVSDQQLQFCPAILLGSPQALPGAIKHVYSRLATGDEDDAMPLLVTALISHNNQFSSHASFVDFYWKHLSLLKYTTITTTTYELVVI